MMKLGQKSSNSAIHIIVTIPLDTKIACVFIWAHSLKDGKLTREEIPISVIPRGSELDKRVIFENIVKSDTEEIELYELATLANEGDEKAIV